MNFNTHSELVGKHAVLSPSNYHWVNYDGEKMMNTVRNMAAKALGTELHELAAKLIKLRMKMPRNNQTFNAYVNDAISWRMSPEVVLHPIPTSYNAFGSADAISFKKDILRIHDLKTGVEKANMKQLEIYAAYFCMEYGVKPGDIQIALRIYQNDEIVEHEPTLETILHIMDHTIRMDRLIDIAREEEAA